MGSKKKLGVSLVVVVVVAVGFVLSGTVLVMSMRASETAVERAQELAKQEHPTCVINAGGTKFGKLVTLEATCDGEARTLEYMCDMLGCKGSGFGPPKTQKP